VKVPHENCVLDELRRYKLTPLRDNKADVRVLRLTLRQIKCTNLTDSPSSLLTVYPIIPECHLENKRVENFVFTSVVPSSPVIATDIATMYHY